MKINTNDIREFAATQGWFGHDRVKWFEAIASELDALRTERNLMKQALDPFGKFLNVRENMRGLTGGVDDSDESTVFECHSHISGEAVLTVGDFRTARDLSCK
jgi:hypothetical protein